MEKADERIISLEAEIRIIREEKKRAEEECQKLRDENYIFRDRLAEIANTHPSPTTSAYLTNEIEALANRVEELTSELGMFSKEFCHFFNIWNFATILKTNISIGKKQKFIFGKKFERTSNSQCCYSNRPKK